MIQGRGFYMLLPSNALYPIYPISGWENDFCIFLLWLISVPTPLWFAERSLNTVLPFNVCRRAQRCSVVKCFKTSYRPERGLYVNKAEKCWSDWLNWNLVLFQCASVFEKYLFVENFGDQQKESRVKVAAKTFVKLKLVVGESFCEGPWKKCCCINVSFWWLQQQLVSISVPTELHH